MARSGGGVDVCLDSLDSGDSPSCPHGPTLLFERTVRSKNGNSNVERFFACSACRDRKDCSFYQRDGEKVSASVARNREERNRSLQPLHTQREYAARFDAFKKLPLNSRCMCQTCGTLLLVDEQEEHKQHLLVEKVSDARLTQPSLLLTPLDCNKKNAQYLFCNKVNNFVLGLFSELGFKKALCIGTPRIHEAFCQRTEEDVIDSLLLDMDHRLGQFYPPQQFCRYNMFNHHFFEGEESREIFTNFLQGSTCEGNKMAVIIDPPFGGLVEVLAHTLNKITSQWRAVNNSASTNLPVFWFFPYFLEHRIKAALPDYTMLDYKVDYENHDSFCGSDIGGKKGSPVRIFTNADPGAIRLPSEEGYRFCAECQRYVAKENRHCDLCKSCTSKDGRQYVHCNLCGKCVKPSWNHCLTCDTCLMIGHTCGLVKSQGCHICGELSHKRRECPQRHTNIPTSRSGNGSMSDASESRRGSSKRKNGQKPQGSKDKKRKRGS